MYNTKAYLEYARETSEQFIFFFNKLTIISIWICALEHIIKTLIVKLV
jgi:hypothetical protein